MGLSSLEFNFLYHAAQKGCLPSGGSILEFGECEVIGLNVSAALEYMLPVGELRHSFLREAEALKTKNDTRRPYDEVKLIYRVFFDYSSYAAIDLAPGAAYRIQQDLNQPFDLKQQYDICINNGTSEHIFNQANFFKAMHDHTKAGGVMIHWTPCLGYYDHGFFNVQPGFFHDLAHANDYEMLAADLVTDKKMYVLAPNTVSAATIAANPDLKEALACVVMRKKTDTSFQYPLQRAFLPLQKYKNAE
jgi:SAM-dependent methyltransferase